MVLGIDLGTSNTVASTLTRDATPVLIPDAFSKDQQSTPSVALIDGNKAFAGMFAENLYETLPDKQLISYFKRNFGTQAPVYFDDRKNAWFSEAVASLILKKVKFDAGMYLPDGFKQCVITVPAHYNDIQRKSVIDAARMAELDLTAIIEEPVAAALYYSSTGKQLDEEIILVYDFGGGTFDLTLITKSGNSLSVIAKDGMNKLGGKEFDEIVMDAIGSHYRQAFKAPLPTARLTANRLQKVAERIKIELHNKETLTDLRKWILVEKDIFEVCFDYKAYTDKAFELVAKTEKAVTRCLRSLGMQLSDVNKMVLIGGTSSSKLVYNYWLKKMAPGQELIYHQPLNSVAKGAALYAASLNNANGFSDISPIELKGVSTYNIGLLTDRANKIKIDLLIHRNTPLPVAARKVYRVNNRENPVMEMELCQYWDQMDGLHLLGTIKAGPFLNNEDTLVEINVENRLNGTIGIKLKDADTGQDIRFEFIKKKSEFTYDYQQQKALVDGIYLNNYL